MKTKKFGMNVKKCFNPATNDMTHLECSTTSDSHYGEKMFYYFVCYE